MSGDPRDYKLDIAGLSAGGTSPAAAGAKAARPYLSVRFACCNVYQRLYREADAKAYRGRCPRCGKPVRFAVADGGTSARFFTAY